MAKVRERVILPGSFQLRPHAKNFIAENVKKLRNLQKQVQKKTVGRNASVHHEKRSPRVTKDVYSDTDASPTIESRVSTPITALESAKPIKNQRAAALKSGKIIKATTPSKEKTQQPLEPLVHVTNFQDTTCGGGGGGGDDFSENDESQSDDKLEQLKQIVSKENKNFVESNTYRLYTEKPKRAKSDTSRLPLNYKRGEIPKYLQNVIRQRQKSEENVLSDPDCPPGFVKLSDEDRQAHLAKLKLTQNELIRKQNSLPLRVDTMTMKQRKADLDRELGKIEEAIKLFSRDKLYVKIGG